MMNNTVGNQTCKYCKAEGSGIYCSNCGNLYATKRITIKSILHDVFHFVTHLDKGFGYTLKQLFTAPGVTQRDYVEGYRAKHQKPFSMFFLCASITALIRYRINIALVDYFNSGNATEGNFFHEYMVLMHSLLLPLYALITWLIFYRSKYNYAEIVVFFLYTLSAFFLIMDMVALLRLIWPPLNTDYIELSLFLIYNAITTVNFFNSSNKWVVIIKSIINMVIVYFIANYAQDFLVSVLKH